MMNEYQNLWIYAQAEGDTLQSSFYELLAKADGVRELKACKLAAVLLGSPSESVLEEVKRSGVDIICIAEHDKLKTYHPEYASMALSEMATKYHPEIIWLTANSAGGEIAPTVACRLKTGLVAHSVDAYLNAEGALVHTVPAFGGRFLSEELVPVQRPIMATFKSGTFERQEISPRPDVEVLREHITALDSYVSNISAGTLVVNSAEEESVEKAEYVVCGGLGAAEEELYAKLKTFATRTNGVLGYTRPVIDMGLETTEEKLIGTSGKSIHPKVYIGFGVSGASHHLFGIKSSNLIIAVNTDPDADIFSACDVKVVKDCDAILTALLTELNR